MKKYIKFENHKQTFKLILYFLIFYISNCNIASATSSDNKFIVNKLTISNTKLNNQTDLLFKTIEFAKNTDSYLEFKSSELAPALNLEIVALLCDSAQAKLNKLNSLVLGQIDSSQFKTIFSNYSSEQCTQELTKSSHFHKKMGAIAEKINTRYLELIKNIKVTIEQLQSSETQNDPYSVLAQSPDVALDFISSLNEMDFNTVLDLTNKISNLKVAIKNQLEKLEFYDLIKESASTLFLATLTGQIEIDVAIAVRILSKLPLAALAIEEGSLLSISAKLRDSISFQRMINMSRDEILIFNQMLRDPKYTELIKSIIKSHTM